MNKTIEQRAKDAMKNLYFIPWSKDRIEAEFIKQLTAQQAEDAQAHKETKSILAGYVKERDEISGILRPRIATISDPYQQAKVIMEKLFAAEKERDALARQIDELTKDKAYILTQLSKTGLIIIYDNDELRYCADFGEQNWTSHPTVIEAITSAMKGETHE